MEISVSNLAIKAPSSSPLIPLQLHRFVTFGNPKTLFSSPFLFSVLDLKSRNPEAASPLLRSEREREDFRPPSSSSFSSSSSLVPQPAQGPDARAEPNARTRRNQQSLPRPRSPLPPPSHPSPEQPQVHRPRAPSRSSLDAAAGPGTGASRCDLPSLYSTAGPRRSPGPFRLPPSFKSEPSGEEEEDYLPTYYSQEETVEEPFVEEPPSEEVASTAA